MELHEYEELNKLVHEMGILVCLQDLVLNYGETLKDKESSFAYKGLYQYLHERQGETLNDMKERIYKYTPIEALANKSETITHNRLK